jgi:predicted ATPase
MGITAIYFLVLQTIAAQRDVRVAKELVAAASAIVERNDERLFEAEFHRIRALTLLAKGGAETVSQAEAELLTALKIAQQQSARSLELRAAMSLAQLWRDQRKSPQARELLAPVYGWFTQGFDTRDLMEAKALLGELVV